MMTKTLLAAAAIALLMTGNPASATDYARNTQDILPLTRALNIVQSRADYERLSRVWFSRKQHMFVMSYDTISGNERVVLIDIATGKEK